jgi:exodeoxyribonuclease V alpha subunit
MNVQTLRSQNPKSFGGCIFTGTLIDAQGNILETMLDELKLGYAITVHKAQGSQWPRIIVPLSGNRLLDRTLVYTAVTRAQRQVILVGDENAARTAVQGLPRAKQRKVALGAVLTGLMTSLKEAP